MENDVKVEASEQDATPSLDSEPQETPQEDSQATSEAASSEALEDLKKRNAGQSKKINELQEKIEELSSLQTQKEQEDTEQQIPEELADLDKKQLQAVEALIEKKLDDKVPQYLSGDETYQKVASRAAREDELALNEFKKRHPDAYHGDNLMSDMDSDLEKNVLAFSKALPNESMDDVLEKAYMATYPDKYSEYLKKGGSTAVSDYKNRQLLGDAPSLKPESDRATKLSASEERFLRGIGVDPKRIAKKK